MEFDNHESRLSALGLSDASYRALLLLPSVRIAWVPGRISPKAKAMVRELGRRPLNLSEHAMQALERWIERPPTGAFYDAGLLELRRLAAAVDEPQFDPAMLHTAMSHAEAVARENNLESSADGAPWAMSIPERTAMREVAAVLGVDHGVTWTGVVSELHDDIRFPDQT